MAIVIPRAFSSGALSIESNARYFTLGFAFDSTLVIAAVSVVLPWSICPIVPTFMCGLDRSNFSLAMVRLLRCSGLKADGSDSHGFRRGSLRQDRVDKVPFDENHLSRPQKAAILEPNALGLVAKNRAGHCPLATSPTLEDRTAKSLVTVMRKEECSCHRYCSRRGSARVGRERLLNCESNRVPGLFETDPVPQFQRLRNDSRVQKESPGASVLAQVAIKFPRKDIVNHFDDIDRVGTRRLLNEIPTPLSMKTVALLAKPLRNYTAGVLPLGYTARSGRGPLLRV